MYLGRRAVACRPGAVPQRESMNFRCRLGAAAERGPRQRLFPLHNRQRRHLPVAEDEEGEMHLISYRTNSSASRPILAVSIRRSLMP